MLQLQLEVHKPLGKLLIEKNIINEEELTKAISTQTNLDYIDVSKNQIDLRTTESIDRYTMLENHILILNQTNGIRPVVSSGQIVDIILDDLAKMISAPIKLSIAKESAIRTLQKEILFPELTEIEFTQLRTVLKQKMVPRNMVSKILDFRKQNNETFIASCQYFGFLPDDQLRRIQL
jgi:hypothetical protein